MGETAEGAEVVRRKDGSPPQPAQVEAGRFDLAEVEDPTAGLRKAEELVQYMASKCSGPEYIAKIQGKDFPRAEWWTSVGASLGLFPQEESVRRLDREGEVAYEATVGVYDGEQRVTRGSAICSDSEATWEGRDENAIRSMAITRATSKAYRNGLSFLAVMADLEPTPAEEMQGAGDDPEDWSPQDTVGFGKHSDLTWEQLAEEQPGYCEWMLDKDVDKAPERAKDYLHGVLVEGDVEEQSPDLPEGVDRIEELLSELAAWDKDRAEKARGYYEANQQGIVAERENIDVFCTRLQDRIEEAKDAAEEEVEGA